MDLRVCNQLVTSRIGSRRCTLVVLVAFSFILIIVYIRRSIDIDYDLSHYLAPSLHLNIMPNAPPTPQSCLWVDSEILGSEWLCNWITHKGTDNPFEMCVSSNRDYIADSLKTKGYWEDCDILPKLFKEKSCSSKAAVEADPDGVYVDVGTNIGSCSLPMVSLGIKTFMFEPVKENLFFLKHSLHRLKKKNGILYQCALSNKAMKHTMYTALGNRGNSILDLEIKDHGDQNFYKNIVHSVLMDDVMWPNTSLPPPHIKLLKMDCQGYEYFVLLGATRLLKAGAIGTIKMEVTKSLFTAHNVSIEQLYSLLDSHNFDFYVNTTQSVTMEGAIAANRDTDFELICKRRNE